MVTHHVWSLISFPLKLSSQLLLLVAVHFAVVTTPLLPQTHLQGARSTGAFCVWLLGDQKCITWDI